MTQRKRPRHTPVRLPWQALAGVVLLATLPYLPAILHEFTFDDSVIVATNPAVQELGHWKLLFFSDYFPGGNTAAYRPMTILSFALERLLHGSGPAGFHLVNILLHAGTSLLVFHVAAIILGTGWAAGLAAGLFAVHPIHTEAVSSVVGRAELLSSFIALSTIWFWIRCSRGEVSARSAGFAVSGLFLLALLSKENVVVLPGLILLWELMRTDGRTRLEKIIGILRNKYFWALLGLIPVYFLLRVGALGGWKASMSTETPFVENPLTRLEPAVRMVNAIANQAHGLWLHFWPHPLIADYSHRTLMIFDSWLNPWGLAFLACIIGSLALWCIPKPATRNAAFASSWYLIAVLPTSNLLFSIGTIFGERLFYFPSVGFCLAIAVAWKLLAGETASGFPIPANRGKQGLFVVTGLIILALSFVTGTRSLVWENDLRLFSDTVAKAPDNVKAHLRLGDALVRSGDPQAAIRQYKQALEIYPEYGPAAANLMVPLQSLGRYQEAIDSGEKALTLFPAENSVLRFNLAMAYLGAGNPEQFLACAQKALSIDPLNARMHFQLGRYYMQQTGDRDLARHHLERALRLDPQNDQAAMIRSMLRRLQ